MPESTIHNLATVLESSGTDRRLAQLLLDMSHIAVKVEHVLRSGITSGHTDQINASGDVMHGVDVLANQIWINGLEHSEYCAAISSEEESNVVHVAHQDSKAPYIVAFDPLDGSSNLDCGGVVGSLFSIHKRINASMVTEQDFLQTGASQVAAGYILYGPTTILVYSTGHGVQMARLASTPDSVATWTIIENDLKLPDTVNFYAANEALRKQWSGTDQVFLDTVIADHPNIKSRYSGALVADVHRALIQGGLLYRPWDHAEKQQAKLRLNFELKPLAWILEQAGGSAVGDKQPINQITPTSLHETSPCIAGPTSLVHAYLQQDL